MSSYRRTQIFTIVALVAAIITLGVGFAAFSTTLNISSSATVSPSSDSFSIGFYANSSQASNTVVKIFPSMGTNASGDSIDITGGSKMLTGLKASFSKPGSSIVYDVVIRNDGEYDAYLNKVYMSQNGTCVAGTGTTNSLVQNACDGIRIAFMIDGYDGNLSGDVNIPIAKGESLNVQIVIRYRAEAAYADGPFNVSFDPISLDFSTVAGSNLMSFTIDGTTYYAERGMTWQEWYDSSYNTSTIYIEKNYICSNDLSNQNLGELETLIVEGASYPLSKSMPCK